MRALAIVFLALAAPSRAADSPSAEKIEVENLQEKYWAKDEKEMRVVRNRLYTKAFKFELAGFGGPSSADPFFSQYQYGGKLGFHLGEYFALAFVGWKYAVSPSSALKTLESQLGTTVNSNFPRTFLGGELSYSPLYGKLSLHGALIIYLDLNLKLGAGLTRTESGNYVTPLVGLGQQIFLARWLALGIDYRLQYYREGVLQKADPSKSRDVIARRSVFTSSLFLGISLLFGFW